MFKKLAFGYKTFFFRHLLEIRLFRCVFLLDVVFLEYMLSEIATY